MAENVNIYPYYSNVVEDFFDKKYKVVFYRPGKAVQARELIDSQLLIHYQGQQNFNTIYKPGSIVKGCDLTVQQTDGTYYCYMGEGQFYFDGRVLDVAEQYIEIDSAGTEYIGLWVEETFVTYVTDEELKDPASGNTNYGLDGADRQKIDVKLVKIMDVVPDPRPVLPAYQKYSDTNNLTSIWDLIDGVVQNYIRRPDYSVISEYLAKRTYDESGNYLVDGMKVETSGSSETRKIKIVVNTGTAYVKGFDVVYPVPRSVDVDKSLVTQQTLNEPHTYSTGTLEYALIKPYVVTDVGVEVIIVTALIEETITITRGSGDYDIFESIYGTIYSSINSIEEISGYTEGVDFELSSDMIHWIGAKPGTGSDYSVTFQYYKNCERDVDFEVSESSTSNIYNIVWLEADLPVNNSSFLVDYYTYKARTDLVSIDKFGTIVIKTGISTNYDKTLIPPFNEEMLPLAWIKFLPGLDYDDCLIYEYNFKRTTMFELYYMKKRLNDLEEDISSLALESEAKEGEELSTLKGIFVDSFSNLYKGDVENVDFNASINLIDQTLQLKSNYEEIDLDRTSDVLTSIETYEDKNGNPKFYTIEKNSESIFFSNTAKSSTVNLNPFGYIKKTPYIELYPDRDEWIRSNIVEEIIVDDETKRTTSSVDKMQWTYTSISDNELVEKKLFKIGANTLGPEKVDIERRLKTYLRTRTVYVYGYNFEPASILYASFGGFYVKLTAVSPYRNYNTGGSEGKIVVASNGTFKCYFTIPANVRSGNIELRMMDENNNIFSAIYRSMGVKRTIQKRTSVVDNRESNYFEQTILKDEPVDILPTPPVTIPSASPEKTWEKTSDKIDVTLDPVAQSFIFKEDKLIVALDLFFATKASSQTAPITEEELYNFVSFLEEYPVILTIGYMKNGFPSNKHILHIERIQPANITTSIYGTIPTHVILKKPVYIPAMQDFYISFGSKSTSYTVYVSGLGESDLVSGNIIMKNPYADGTLFLSSNGITWNAEQKKDLSIVLYEGVYGSSAEFETEDITYPRGDWTGYGRFIFSNDYVEIPDTDVQFYYSTNSGSTWNAFNTAEEIDLDAATTSLKFKCVLSTNNTSLSPIVNLQSNLIMFKYDVSATGEYLNKIIENMPPYNNVKIILDECLRGSVNVIKEFCFTDIYGGTEWLRIVYDEDEETDLENGFYRRIYTFDLLLLQRLIVDSTTGYTVGSEVGISGSWPTVVGRICAINSDDNYIYVLRESDGSDEFEGSDTLTDGVTETLVSAVMNYDSEPLWPEDFTGRLLLESTSYWRTPIVKNYRAIMRAL